MSSLVIQPQKTPLNGTVRVPGDKSISHRAVMLAAIAQGTSVIRNWLPAGDTIATLEAMRVLGAPITIEQISDQAWDLEIEGRGFHGLRRPPHPLDCRNAGTCMRLLAGILAGQRFPSVLDGSEQLRRRPMGRIVSPLHQMGANIEAREERAPLHFRPAKLKSIDYVLPVASAQVKSAVLLAGLYARGETRIYQPGPARDHTERLLQAMGAIVHSEDRWIVLQSPFGNGPSSEETIFEYGARPEAELQPLDLTVPGDLSSAAFLLVAAAIVPHSQITIRDVGHNETRTGILDIIAAMGGAIEVSNRHITGGEPAVDLTSHFDELHNTTVAGDTVVRAIDEFPAWAVAATQAAGPSTLREAAELRVKEVDRISLLAGELRKMAAPIQEHPDGFTVNGPIRLQGAQVDSHGDHRLGMALAVAGLAATEPTRVDNADCIADSFPGFVETMLALGANIHYAESA